MCGVWGSCRPHHPATLTDEEDGKGDEEEEDMWHHIERIQETAVVQNPPIHVVRHWVILVPAERQGHGGTGTLQGTGRRKMRRRRGRRTRDRGERDLTEALRACCVFKRHAGGSRSRSWCFPKWPTRCSLSNPAPKYWIQWKREDRGRAGRRKKGSETVTVQCSCSSLSFPAV